MKTTIIVTNNIVMCESSLAVLAEYVLVVEK